MDHFKALNIISHVARSTPKLNILTFNTHERYQTQLAKTGHDFYSFNYDGGKEWYPGHGPMPHNCYQLPKNAIFPGIMFDFILVQSKFGQFQTAVQLNKILQLPIICLEHTLPIPSWPDQQLQMFQNMLGDINVFITDYSKLAWGINGEVLYHSVDTELFTPPADGRKKQILTVAHDFINRDYALNYSGWKRITEGLPSAVVGQTEGLSKQSDSVDDLIEAYQNSLVYINPSTLSPVPTSMLEAMACGCAIVSTKTCGIPSIIEHGVNGFMSNDEMELRQYCEQLLNDPALAQKMGEAARQTIKQKFSEERFVREWNSIFEKAMRIN